MQWTILCLVLLLGCSPAFAAGRRRSGALASGIQTFTETLAANDQRRQASYDAAVQQQQGLAQEALVALLNSGYYVISSVGDPIDLTIGGVALTRVDHLGAAQIPSTATASPTQPLTRFCPIGGERYPKEAPSECPKHHATLRELNSF